MKKLLFNEQGAVSLYLVLIVVPIFLFCAVFIDFARLKAAEKQSENAVKTGLRSALSAYSPALQPYGLYALDLDAEQSNGLFRRVIEGNLSGGRAAPSFRYIDTSLEPGTERLMAMYSLANHQVLRQQILEEMKYRAPVQYSLEIADKFKASGVAAKMTSVARFAEHAEKVESLLEKRDAALDLAWDEVVKLRTKAETDYPFYESHLTQLNELSEKIGTHTVEELTETIRSGKAQLRRLRDSIESIDDSLESLSRAGRDSYDAIRSLLDEKRELQAEMRELRSKIAEWEQLLAYALEYVKLLAALKLKSSSDYEALSAMLSAFNEKLAEARKANDALNEELAKISRQSDDLEAGAVFRSIYGMGHADFDDYASKASSIVSLFGGLKSQLQAVVFFTTAQYARTAEANVEYRAAANGLYAGQSPKEAARNRNKQAAAAGRKAQRNKAQPYLDQAVKAIGGCSVSSAGDPYGPLYALLEGERGTNPAGYFRQYMELNGETAVVPDVEETRLDNADKAGKSAMKLIGGLADLLVEARDDMFLNEFALSKFSYRTFGMEKDGAGNVKPTFSLTAAERHPLYNQEVEYMIYGSSSCAGNYGKAYAELFAIRLAIGTIESLTEPQNELLNLGSPLLVLLAAVAEGAVKAQADMVRLLDGEAVPLSAKIGKGFTLHYKDYMRLFLLLHGRDKVMLSRVQSLVHLNTDTDLRLKPTYVQGSATLSVRLWFMPGLMKAIRPLGVHDCKPAGSRCEFVKTAYLAY